MVKRDGRTTLSIGTIYTDTRLQQWLCQAHAPGGYVMLRLKDRWQCVVHRVYVDEFGYISWHSSSGGHWA